MDFFTVHKAERQSGEKGPDYYSINGNGWKLDATPDHLILTKRNEDIKFIHAKKIKTGDQLQIGV